MTSVVLNQVGEHATSFEPLLVPEQVHKSYQTHDVVTSLNYYKDPGDGSEPPAAYVGKPETYNLPLQSVEVTVRDIRGSENQYTLDENGFAIHYHKSSERDYEDEEKIKSVYYAETEQLLKDATGATRVFIFDHTIRRPSAVAAGGALRGPVTRVHVDQSYSAAKNRVPHHLPEDADTLLRTRYQIINVWRPIKTVLKDPLGVADARSVAEDDLVPVGLIYPDRRGETLTVKPNPKHEWRYLYGQTPEEVLLIKCFDSKLDGRARRVPHTAFENPATKNESARESIEVRALVFHENDSAE